MPETYTSGVWLVPDGEEDDFTPSTYELCAEVD